MAQMVSGKPLPRDFEYAMLTARLDVVIRRTTKHALQSMARRHGLTQAAMLEAIVSHYRHLETTGLGIKDLLEYYANTIKQKRSVTTVTKRIRRK